MADLLKKKKMYEKMIKEDADSAAKNQPMVEKTQKAAKDILAQMEKYSAKNKSFGVVAYAQFQSMSGKEKFIKSIRTVGWCMRCCSNRYNHKFLRGKWP